MLPLRGMTMSLAAVAVLAVAGPASAGWQSVFQVCCHNCSTPSVSSYFGGGYSSGYYSAGYDGGGGCCPQTCCQPCCDPCPKVVATTNYVQRTFYQPVTTYCTKTYYEPCTTYRTSYYYEPVTCMRYSCCYDPCTCSYRQVATAHTSYRLRSQCCPVTSYIQRCCQVPVTTYQKACYWEAQTCYSLVDPCTGRAISNGAASGAPAVAETPSGVTNPGVQEYRAPAVPAPSGAGSTNSPLFNSQPPPPEGSGSSYRKNNSNYAEPPKPVVPKYDRIAFDTPATGSQANLAGQVVSQNGTTPKSGARLLFVSEAPTGQQESASADAQGKFKVTLASGGWLVYLRDAEGKAVYHSRVQVKGSEAQQMTLVSR